MEGDKGNEGLGGFYGLPSEIRMSQYWRKGKHIEAISRLKADWQLEPVPRWIQHFLKSLPRQSGTRAEWPGIHFVYFISAWTEGESQGSRSPGRCTWQACCARNIRSYAAWTQLSMQFHAWLFRAWSGQHLPDKEDRNVSGLPVAPFPENIHQAGKPLAQVSLASKSYNGTYKKKVFLVSYLLVAFNLPETKSEQPARKTSNV